MEPLTIHRGTVIPLDVSNVDTDAILPKEFLKRIERTGFGQFLFYYWRFDEKGLPNKNFVLNQERYQESSILLTRKNFGCGSSREHAPWALEDFGIKVIIAESFADIFYNNCLKNGILPITLHKKAINYLFSETDNSEPLTLTVDLKLSVIKDDKGFQSSFEIDEFRKKMLLEGLDDIDWTFKYFKEISSFEKGHSIYYSFK